MKLKNILLATVVAGSMSANAAEVAGEKLNVYGKIHVSINSSDKDDPATTNDGMSISSNSSRLGFKGKLATDSGIDVLYQIEQEVAMDDHSAAELASRNSFVGLGSGENSVIAGIHDTPFKSVGSGWGIFGDTVGERRAILGASYSRGNQLNERVSNMVMYQFKSKAAKVQAMYSVDGEGNNAGSSNVDDNDVKMKGLGVWFNVADVKLSVGWEDWKAHSTIEDGSAFRVAAVFKAGSHQFGAIFEDIDTDGMTANALSFNRSAYGVNWKWKVTDKADFRVQYLVADSADNTTDTGANKIGVGVFYSLDKAAKVYFAYGKTSNDANAKFQAVDGGHGDEVKTVNGGEPSAMSVGMEFKF